MKILLGNTYEHRVLIKQNGGTWDDKCKRWLVPEDKFEYLNELCNKNAKRADKSHFQGQLWESCSCGCEPVYMPSHKCEKCINRIWGK